MSLDPVDLIGGLSTSANVSKEDFRAYEKARNIGRFESIDEVRNTDLSARFVIFVGSYLYVRNTGDTTTADDGASVLVSDDGGRWFRIGVASFNPMGNWAAPTTFQIGDVVTYNNSSFVGITEDNVGNIPAIGSSHWQLIAAAGSPGGPITIPYTFSTTTTDADPGAGKLRLGSATQNSATVIRADLLDNLGSTWTGVLDTFDASTSTIKGFIRIQHEFDETKWLLFTLSARAAPSGYRNFTVACVGYSAASPFAANDPLLLEFIRNGDKGDPGSTGPAAWTAAAAWLTATAYVSGPPASLAVFGGESYECLVSHTSGTFATDLAAGKWIKVAAAGATGSPGTSQLTVARAAAVANVALASGLENGDTIDGVTLVTGDRVILTNQTAPAENGVYTVVASGAASRDASFSTYDSLPGVLFSIQEGTVNHDTLWHVTSDKGGTIDVTALAISTVSTGGGSADGFGRARCVATTNVSLSNGLENGDSVGGVTLATGDSVLLTGQTAPAENGLYTAVASGAAARHTSFATYNSIAGSFFAVSDGTRADTLWNCTSNAGGTIDSTAIAISEFNSATDDWGLVTGSVTTSDDWGSV